MSLVVERGKEIQEWQEPKIVQALPSFSGGKLPGRSTAEQGREEEEEVGESRQRQMKNGVVEEVFAGRIKKDRELEGTNSTSQRAVERRVRQKWNCSQIEDRDEEEVVEWHVED